MSQCSYFVCHGGGKAKSTHYLPGIVRLFLFAVLLLTQGYASAESPESLTVKTLDDGVIYVENAFTIVEISTQFGGRLQRLTVKDTGDNLLYWNATEFLGGLLDDKSTTAMPHELKILQQDSTTFRIELSVNQPNSTNIRKTLTFRGDTPTIRVDFRHENWGQASLRRSLFVRNFVRPGGVDITEADIYCLSTSGGIVQANSADLITFNDTSGQMIENIAAPWQAFVNRDRRQGLAFAYLDDSVEAYYSWRESVAYPTFEWFYRPLDAGMAMETSFMVVPVRLSAVSFANEQIVVNIPDTEGVIEVVATWEPQRNVVLHTKDLDADGHTVASYPAVDIGDLAAGRTNQIAYAPPGPAAKAAIRQYSIRSGEKDLATFHNTIKGKTFGTSGLLSPKETAAAKITPLAAWKKDKKWVPFIAEADTLRGYALYKYEGEDIGGPLTSMRFDIAPSLRESVFAGFKAVKDVGQVRVACLPNERITDQWLKQYVQVRLETSTPMPANRSGLKGKMYQLRPLESFSPKTDNEEKIWLTVYGKDVKPGEYAFDLQIKPAKGNAAILPVKVKVWPVKLPERRRVSLEAEHCLTLLPGCYYREDWSLEAIDAYTRNMAEHGVNFVQVYPFTNAVWGYIKIKGADENLAASIQKDPKLLHHRPLPELDFSFFNPWIDTALKNGLYCFSSYSTLTDPSFAPPEQTGGSSESINIDVWFWSEVHKYVQSRGYRPEDIYVKVLDEMPADQIPEMANIMQQMKRAGWKVYSTYSTIFRYPELTRLVDSASDMWQFGGWNYSEYSARCKNGDIDPTDEQWTYFGWGTAWRSYQAMRAPGWEAAFCRLDGFHSHEYYRWAELAVAAIVTIENNRPVDSPAFEGLADGLSDAQLLAELLHVLDKGASRRGLPANDSEAAAVLGRIVGSGDDATIPIQLVTGERAIRAMRVIDSENVAGTVRYRKARREILSILSDLQNN
jgi:hypothetical protein